MDRLILDYLEAKYKVTPPRAFYAEIAKWDAWRRGFFKPFHEFSENGAGGFPVKRELYRLNMAKKICEDWATLILADKTVVTSSDSAVAEWLGGADGEHGFLGEQKFIKNAARLVEKAFSLGTGAAILRIDGVTLDGGYLTGCPEARLGTVFVDAEHIVPISTENGKITEAAFISESMRDGIPTVYVEIHRRGADGYVITNELLKKENGELIPDKLPRGVAGEVRTGTFVPFFAILKPNLTNHVDESCGLGVSVYAQATDCLKGVDLAFNNFCRDLKLGGKKVFMNRNLVMRDGNGTLYTPDDVAQQLFVTVGDGDLAEETMITEHNPDLRTKENAEAVQSQLDYLSFRCGMGTRQYLFSGVQGKAQLTATQYTGERQDLIQTTAHHRINACEFISDYVRAALTAAVKVLCLPLDASAPVTVNFDDSYFIDSESQRARDREEVAAGLMKPWEFRMKWRGESEERARAMTEE